MSKIGKKPITIPDGVIVAIKDGVIECKGALGTVTIPRLPFVSVKAEDKIITFSPTNDSEQARANWGTLRSLVQSGVTGSVSGFKKTLLIDGVGYRAATEGGTLVLNIGYSHPVRFFPPEGVTVSVQKNAILVSGIRKDSVGQTAAKIRSLKKPEPYKGKGIRYENEIIRRKDGKKTAGATK